MKLKDYTLEEGNHFVALEYYKLILNRTLLVLILEDSLIGLKVNGAISTEGGGDSMTRLVSKKLAIQGDLTNPYSYMNDKYIKKLENLNIIGDDILKVDSSNFKISRSLIRSVTYDKRKKWGMGYYPHDGKVYVKTGNGKKKEFVILGSQSGEQIASLIEKRH